ncbi:MAG TPA: MFS transporter [Thermoplasmata archaeon]|nr:MFS transporter [Thermoplasmata archaeon]
MRRPGGARTVSYRELASNRSFFSLSLAGAGSFAAPTASLVVLLYTIASTFASSAHPVELGALALAFLGLSSTIPTLVTAIFAGTIADRADRLRLLRWVNAAALVATIGIAALLALRPSAPVAIDSSTGFYFPEWIILLYPLWAIETTAVTLFRPAFNASVPLLVSRPQLGRANGMVYAEALVFSIFGSLAAGLATNAFGAASALVIPVAFFLVTQAFLLGVTAPISAPRSGPFEPFLREAKAGYRFLYERRPLLGLTLAALAINFFSAVAFVELGLYVVNWLQVNAALLVGAMMSGGSLGAAVGTLLVNRFPFERRAGQYLVVLVVLQGLTVAVLGLVRTVWLALPDMFLFGLFPGMFTTIFFATIQAVVPNHILGRVLAADEVGSFAMIPVGQYVGGFVTAVEGIPFTYIIAGVGTTTVGLLMGVYGALRRLGFSPAEAPTTGGSLTPPSPLREPEGSALD